MCRRRLIFPGGCPPSIVSTSELNYRVRNGNGWTLIVIGTDSIFNAFNVKSIYILHRFRAVFFGDPYGIRTHVAGVRGRSLRPLDQRATLPKWRYIKHLTMVLKSGAPSDEALSKTFQ